MGKLRLSRTVVQVTSSLNTQCHGQQTVANVID
jgi:hypothetical protein